MVFNTLVSTQKKNYILKKEKSIPKGKDACQHNFTLLNEPKQIITCEEIIPGKKVLIGKQILTGKILFHEKRLQAEKYYR